MKIIFESEKEKSDFQVNIIYLIFAIVKLTKIPEAITVVNNIIMMVNNSEVKKK